jgi:O-antigen ligase
VGIEQETLSVGEAMITYASRFDFLRRSLAILIGLSIPISTALTNILCPLALLLILAEGQYQLRFQRLRQLTIVVVALLLFGIILVGMINTPVSLTATGRMVDKYRELLYIPLFILLFRDNTTRRWGLFAFLGAMGITLFLSYLMAMTGWHFGKSAGESSFVVFKNYITQGLLMSLAAYFVTVQFLQHRTHWRWLQGVVIFLAVYNIVFMSQGRTGYVVLASLILLLMFQWQQWRGILIGVIVIAILSSFAYLSSEVVKQRVDKVSSGFQDYQQGEPTSIPMRIGFLKNTLILVSQHPLLGAGTGSFAYQYRQLAEPKGMILTVNPHNEYLMIAAQWGLLGASLFVYLLYQLWHTSHSLSPPTAKMAQGLVVAMGIGCLFNSLLLDSTEGHLFAYLVGVFWGEYVADEERLS